MIPAGGKPRSLGTMADKKHWHVRLADALAQLLQQGATIAISVEPRGGSPTGAPRPRRCVRLPESGLMHPRARTARIWW